MDEYVKKSDIGLTDFEIILCKGSYKEALLMLFDKIEHLPAADVRPVVRGRWIVKTDADGKTYGVCSECGYEQYAGHLKFCPNCGADMRSEQFMEGD